MLRLVTLDLIIGNIVEVLYTLLEDKDCLTRTVAVVGYKGTAAGSLKPLGRTWDNNDEYGSYLCNDKLEDVFVVG